jgi:tetratricopeptide (TPR) repeat protein
MLPLLLGIIGLLYQAYAGKKGIEGFWVTFALFFMTGIAIVLYLNQTTDQPRERDYAYAGSFYAFCIWVGFGVAGLAKALEKYAKVPGVVAGAVASVACLLVPLQMASQNWDDHDRSNRYTARDFGRNYLESCEPDAIIFTNGDNDTFPLWYAQEVEGIRTDVRVCNTSYLQTDWYTDQMKRQAYESSPLPISWTLDEYIQGKHDEAYIVPNKDNKPIGIREALDFVRSEDPRSKRKSGPHTIDVIPAQALTLWIDSAAVVGSGTLSPQYQPYMLPELSIDLNGKTRLAKQELTILDMLHTNNWQRPMYYAISVAPDQFAGLEGYFQQTGMAYQVVPMDTRDNERSIHTEKMYDNVMNKFKWGNVDKPGVYIDETVMRACKTYRMNVFTPLASALINEGENEKALKVLDKAMEVLPPENVPLDYSVIYIANYYYQLGAKEKAEAIFDEVARIAEGNLRWFFRLRPSQRVSIIQDFERNLQVLQEAIRRGEQYESAYVDKYKEAFSEFVMKYSAITQD